ncbi:MAG: AsmA family protein [Thermodesulfobacteriota bacterium]
MDSHHAAESEHARRPAWPRRALIVLAGLAGLGLLGLAAVHLLLLSYDYDAFKPRLAAAVREATGRELTLGGRLGLAVSATPRLEVDNLSLSNPAWCSQPVMFAARRALVEVDLWPLLWQRRLVVRRLGLEGLELNLERDPQGRTNLAFDPPASAEPSAPAAAGGEAGEASALRLSFQSVEVAGAKLRWRDQVQAIRVELEVESLKLDQAGEGQALRLQAAGGQDNRPWRVAADLAGAGPGGARPLRLELAWGEASLNAAGQVGDPAGLKGLDLQVDLHLPDPAALGLGGPPGPWRLQGRLRDPAAGTWRLDSCRVEAGGSDLQGWVEFVSGNPRPRLSAELRAAKLDLGNWRSGPALAASGGQPTGQGTAFAESQTRVFPAGPLPLAWLDKLDIQLALKAAHFQAPGLDWQELELNLGLAGGRLELHPLRAIWSGGQLTLRLGLAPADNGHAADLELGLRGSQLGPILRQAGVREAMEGELEAGAALRGQGDSVAGIMASLSGKIWQVLRRGKLHQRFLAILGADLAGGLASVLGGLFGGRDYSEVNCLILGLVAKDGLAATTALALDSERVVMLGRGQLDLRTERLEVAFNPQAKGGLTSPGGVGLNLSELAKPFKLTGALAHPRLSLDAAEALATLGKSLGGMFLLGPAGLAAGLASAGGEPSGLCQDALAAARRGEVYQPKGGVGEPVKKIGDGIGGAIEKLFGR